VEAALDQTAESLATVPLLADALDREGNEAPITIGLPRVLAGEASADHWRETVRSARPARRRTHAA
jgi:hypothetical protein